MTDRDRAEAMARIAVAARAFVESATVHRTILHYPGRSREVISGDVGKARELARLVAEAEERGAYDG